MSTHYLGWAETEALMDAINPFVRSKSDDQYVAEERRMRVDVLTRPSKLWEKITTISGERPIRVPPAAFL